MNNLKTLFDSLVGVANKYSIVEDIIFINFFLKKEIVVLSLHKYEHIPL